MTGGGARRLVILGATGSIGVQALDVVARSDDLRVVGLSAESSWERLVEQATAHGVPRVALADPDAGARAAQAWTEGEVLTGPEGLVRLVVESGADLVLNALVGPAGLGPTVAARGEGIDLALANKGLELIEAHHLFGLAYDRLDVIVHPQSIVHGFVHLCDGATLAHLGYPDMRVPISFALHYPERVDVPVDTLDLAAVAELAFEPVDEAGFPCLARARAAGRAGGTSPCVLNAANEVAVHAFLGGRLAVRGIWEVIEGALERIPPAPVRAFDSLYEADREARAVAAELVQGLTLGGAAR